MSKCKIVVDFSIDAPNLVLLRLIIPYIRIPTFKNLGSLVTGTIVLVDSCLGDDFQGLSDADHSGETDDVDDDSDTSENYNMGYGHAYIGDYSYGTNGTYKYSEIISDCDDEKYGYHGDGHNCSKDGNYCDYGATANYGRNESKSLDVNSVLQSLRNARTLELLSYSGEVLLNRDFKSCPTFSNLKTMSLGEWCIAADFDALVLLLQHSPNLERLFLELILNLNIRKALERGLKLKERSFACKHLRMVEIKCSKDDVRVHMLAELFKANGIPHEKLYVHWPGCAVHSSSGMAPVPSSLMRSAVESSPVSPGLLGAPLELAVHSSVGTAPMRSPCAPVQLPVMVASSPFQSGGMPELRNSPRVTAATPRDPSPPFQDMAEAPGAAGPELQEADPSDCAEPKVQPLHEVEQEAPLHCGSVSGCGANSVHPVLKGAAVVTRRSARIAAMADADDTVLDKVMRRAKLRDLE